MKKVFIFIVISLLFQTSFVSAFELQDFNGSTLNFQDKIGKGKWTLVLFWAHDCSVCRVEAPLISDFDDKRDDLDVIGISIDGESKKHLALEFLEATKPSFPSYIGNLALVATNYEIMTGEGFRGTPTFILFTPDGSLIGNNPGKVSVEALEGFIDRNS